MNLHTAHWDFLNRLKNKLFLDEGMDFEVQDENEEAFPRVDEILREKDLRGLENDRFLLRQKALNASNNATQKMVKRELKRNPPSLYFIEETVLVRIPSSKKAFKGKKKSLKSTHEGRVVDMDHALHRYKIQYTDPVTLKEKKFGSKLTTLRLLQRKEKIRDKKKLEKRALAKSENALSEGLIKKENLPRRRSV